MDTTIMFLHTNTTFRTKRSYLLLEGTVLRGHVTIVHGIKLPMNSILNGYENLYI